MFLDEIELTFRGGKGGDGCSSFRREKFQMRGGPDGGDGGDGGSVVVRTTSHENTLYHLAGRRVFEARGGQPGRGSDMTGASAADLVIDVPAGTAIFDAERGHLLKDLDGVGLEFVIARGGAGGRGNARFATSTNRAPREFEAGQQGEERRVRLSLKLIADVGLVGLPNAGKSTFLASVSRARPKIASYPFTTLEPVLGIVPFGEAGSLVIADIPGLIEGASGGRGLGVTFLKHIERTRVLLHLVDCSSAADVDPALACRTIRAELAGYSEELAGRPCVLVATKVEDDESRARAEALEQECQEPVWRISAATREGVSALLTETYHRCHPESGPGDDAGI